MHYIFFSPHLLNRKEEACLSSQTHAITISMVAYFIVDLNICSRISHALSHIIPVLHLNTNTPANYAREVSFFPVVLLSGANRSLASFIVSRSSGVVITKFVFQRHCREPLYAGGSPQGAMGISAGWTRVARDGRVRIKIARLRHLAFILHSSSWTLRRRLIRSST
jgi:hypothetical protein